MGVKKIGSLRRKQWSQFCFDQTQFLVSVLLTEKCNCLYLWTHWLDRNNFNIKSLHISSPNIFLSFFSALLSLLSFGILSFFWPLQTKRSFYLPILLSYFVCLSMIHHSELKKGHIFTSGIPKMHEMSKINEKSENVNKREFFKNFFST